MGIIMDTTKATDTINLIMEATLIVMVIKGTKGIMTIMDTKEVISATMGNTIML